MVWIINKTFKKNKKLTCLLDNSEIYLRPTIDIIITSSITKYWPKIISGNGYLVT